MNAEQTKLYSHVVTGLRKSAALETYLQAHTDEALLATKTAHDVQLFQHIKTAGAWNSVSKAVSPHLGTLGTATAIAAPVTAAGAYLMHRAGQESRDTAADIRNKALQAALGIGAIGAGLYGMHRLTQPTTEQSINYGRDPRTGQMVPTHIGMHKRSSVEETPDQLLEKLATVGYLDVLLEAQEKHANEAVRQDARECRMLNAEHAVDILRQLLP